MRYRVTVPRGTWPVSYHYVEADSAEEARSVVRERLGGRFNPRAGLPCIEVEIATIIIERPGFDVFVELENVGSKDKPCWQVSAARDEDGMPATLTPGELDEAVIRVRNGEDNTGY
jgi:hypothetical protein